jgi:N-acetylglucosaminyldiphosphoundecaprenol N-acetyl-beta-D-mannosaminyltransferase
MFYMPSPPRTVTTLGYTVLDDDLSKIPFEGPKGRVINTISPNSYGVAKQDTVFRDALRNSDFLALDGVYFAYAPLIMKGKNIRKNQGPDIFYHFMQRLEDMGGKAFFLGSSEKTLEKIRENAALKYPHIQVHTYSPPFKAEFSEADNDDMASAVNAVRPDVLFIGMTCPKQEKWSVAHKQKLDASLIVCIGNVFDWFAGTQKAIHPIWFKLRVGWLVRIFLRPEIFRRNIGNQMTFFKDATLIALRLKKPD